MSLLLHLSDIHLGPVADNQIVDDYKSEIVPLDERTTRVTLLKETLRTLGSSLARDGRKLDGVVVSGDITVANKKEGYELFESVLGQLGSSLPPPGRIVVVPGNHDVAWQTKPSSRERYVNFLTYIRAKNYVTPMLDGIDSALNETTPLVEFQQHYLLDVSRRWVMVPINSADYCGTYEPVSPITEGDWSKLPDALVEMNPSLDKKAVAKTLHQLRLRDIPRVSPWQLSMLATMLRAIDIGENISRKKLLKIVVLHHHLLPVSASEEFKAFESIINLGHLRQFLRAQGISLVLHGHKHTGLIYRDQIHDYLTDDMQPTLVLSGPTIGTPAYDKACVCRLIDIGDDEHAPVLSVSDIPVLRQGVELPKQLPSHKYPLWREPHPRLTTAVNLITVENCAQGYSRLLTLFEGRSQRSALTNVICHVLSAEDAGRLPSTYPDLTEHSVEERQARFNDLVGWWQRPQSSLRGPLNFTHGSRIRAYASKIDQFERAVKILNEKPDSSRAIVILIDPNRDDTSDSHIKFPSFGLAQFLVRSEMEGRYLDCIGFFRKQEIRYWWPVNVAELARLQLHMLERVRKRHTDLNVGSIVTIAASAIAASIGAPPLRVVVPTVDRKLDEDPAWLWSMVYAVFRKDLPNREQFHARWHEALSNLLPGKEPAADGDPIAIDGLKFLRREMEKFVLLHQDNADGRRLMKQLEYLVAHNEVFEESIAKDTADPGIHAKWRMKVEELVREMQQLVDALFKA